MKKLILALLCVITVTIVSFTPSALAGDVANGGRVFSANCASCHAGGRNLVNAAKTLSKGDLEKYGMYSLEAITNQVTKGKNAMPAFAGRLSETQIDDVSAYVLAQADKGW